MGKLTLNEQTQIKRTEKALGIKLTKEQIIGILGRNPFIKKTLHKPKKHISSEEVMIKKLKGENIRKLRTERTQVNRETPLHLHRLFADDEAIRKRRERQMRREAESNAEPFDL